MKKNVLRILPFIISLTSLVGWVLIIAYPNHHLLLLTIYTVIVSPLGVYLGIKERNEDFILGGGALIAILIILYI